MSTSRRPPARRLREIRLHLPEGNDPLDLEGVREYLSSLFQTVEVRIAESPFSKLDDRAVEEVGRRLAGLRVKDPGRAHQDHVPMYGEIDYELRVLSGGAKAGGVVYDGRKMLDLYAETMSSDLDPTTASVVFTQRLVTTYSHDDLRHHLRMIVCGFPSIISIPGVVEAPARPREYHIIRQQLEAAGAGDFQLEQLKAEFKGRFIDHGDDAIAEVLKGLALQATIFHLTLDPFCDFRRCRLFNAHWQEDLIESQVRSGVLCGRHKRQLSELGRNPNISW